MKSELYHGLGIADEEFIRGQIPMTKQNIRILCVAKLHLQKDSIVYDIGAGTGSVSVEMAFLCEEGKVYSFEKKEEGIELIKKNVEKFELENVTVVSGVAPESLANIEAPTHVFIGGSSGNLVEIINAVREKNRNAKFVVTAITLETLSKLVDLSKREEYSHMTLEKIDVASAKVLGDYHMMQGENPVYIASF